MFQGCFGHIFNFPRRRHSWDQVLLSCSFSQFRRLFYTSSSFMLRSKLDFLLRRNRSRGKYLLDLWTFRSMVPLHCVVPRLEKLSSFVGICIGSPQEFFPRFRIEKGIYTPFQCNLFSNRWVRRSIFDEGQVAYSRSFLFF